MDDRGAERQQSGEFYIDVDAVFRAVAGVGGGVWGCLVRGVLAYIANGIEWAGGGEGGEEGGRGEGEGGEVEGGRAEERQAEGGEQSRYAILYKYHVSIDPPCERTPF